MDRRAHAVTSCCIDSSLWSNNEMKRQMKLAEMTAKTYGGWEIYCLTNKVILFYLLVRNYFDLPAATEVRRERLGVYPERRFR